MKSLSSWSLPSRGRQKLTTQSSNDVRVIRAVYEAKDGQKARRQALSSTALREGLSERTEIYGNKCLKQLESIYLTSQLLSGSDPHNVILSLELRHWAGLLPSTILNTEEDRGIEPFPALSLLLTSGNYYTWKSMDGYYKLSFPFSYIHKQTLKTGPGTLLWCDQVRMRELHHDGQEVTAQKWQVLTCTRVQWKDGNLTLSSPACFFPLSSCNPPHQRCLEEELSNHLILPRGLIHTRHQR